MFVFFMFCSVNSRFLVKLSDISRMLWTLGEVLGAATPPASATIKGPSSERGDPPAEMRADLFEAQSLE